MIEGISNNDGDEVKRLDDKRKAELNGGKNERSLDKKLFRNRIGRQKSESGRETDRIEERKGFQKLEFLNSNRMQRRENWRNKRMRFQEWN